MADIRDSQTPAESGTIPTIESGGFMKKVLGLLVALALVVGACGDDSGGGGVTDPAEAQSCDELVDVLFNIIQAAVDSVSELSVTEFMDLADDSMPPELARMDTFGEALEARALVLGCSAEEAQIDFCARVGELKADSAVAELLVSSIASNC